MQLSLPRLVHLTLTWVSSNYTVFYISDIYKISLLFSVKKKPTAYGTVQSKCFLSLQVAQHLLSSTTSNTTCMFISSPESCCLISIVLLCGLGFFLTTISVLPCPLQLKSSSIYLVLQVFYTFQNLTISLAPCPMACSGSEPECPWLSGISERLSSLTNGIDRLLDNPLD